MMISFNLHIPSIVIGFLLGSIIISILWIIVSLFGDVYMACIEYYKLKSEKTKNDEIHTESKK